MSSPWFLIMFSDPFFGGLDDGDSHQWWLVTSWLPSGNLLHSYGKLPIEIVDLPNLKMVIFNSKLLVYQRVPMVTIVGKYQYYQY